MKSTEIELRTHAVALNTRGKTQILGRLHSALGEWTETENHGIGLPTALPLWWIEAKPRCGEKNRSDGNRSRAGNDQAHAQKNKVEAFRAHKRQPSNTKNSDPAPSKREKRKSQQQEAKITYSLKSNWFTPKQGRFRHSSLIWLLEMKNSELDSLILIWNANEN
jgi:hypothetical protein